MERIILIGMSLVFIGIILIFIGGLFSAFKSPEKSNVNVAAGGFIGPFPFGYFSDKRMFYILIALMFFSLLLWWFLSR